MIPIPDPRRVDPINRGGSVWAWKACLRTGPRCTSRLWDRYRHFPVYRGGLDGRVHGLWEFLTPGSARTPQATLGYVEKVRSQFLSLRH
jgi:hypothetical protein